MGNTLFFPSFNQILWFFYFFTFSHRPLFIVCAKFCVWPVISHFPWQQLMMANAKKRFCPTKFLLSPRQKLVFPPSNFILLWSPFWADFSASIFSKMDVDEFRTIIIIILLGDKLFFISSEHSKKRILYFLILQRIFLHKKLLNSL